MTLADTAVLIAFFVATVLALVVAPIVLFLTIRDIWRDIRHEQQQAEAQRRWDADVAKFETQEPQP